MRHDSQRGVSEDSLTHNQERPHLFFHCGPALVDSLRCLEGEGKKKRTSLEMRRRKRSNGGREGRRKEKRGREGKGREIERKIVMERRREGWKEGGKEGGWEGKKLGRMEG
jgi:hypothetical protein